MIKLPVIQPNRQGKITEKEYDDAGEWFQNITKKYNTCDIDQNGVCRKYKETYYPDNYGKRTCCDASLDIIHTICPNLSDSGCMTKNLACFHELCSVALEVIPVKVRNEVIEMQSRIRDILTKNCGTFRSNYYFISEKDLKNKLTKNTRNPSSRRGFP